MVKFMLKLLTVFLIIASFNVNIFSKSPSVPKTTKELKPQNIKEWTVSNVLVAPYSGIISPVAAEFLTGAIDKGNSENFDLIVIKLDTPGGLDPSMREIIKKILGSRVPVALYVYPQGARAASAGVFIAMASHIVAMSPGTNIGAAHPIMIGAISGSNKKEKSSLEDKILNDASAYMKSITQKRKRNVDWAIKAVTKSDSLSAEEALKNKVVDFIAHDLNDFISKINGFEIPEIGVLKTKDPQITFYNPTKRQKFLAIISDPNIAMILMSLGAAGLFIELYNPGLILPGVVGAVSLVLAFYSFQTLSANFAGVLLILLGFLFFIIEIKIISYGLLTLSGIVSIVLGALMLFNQPSISGGISIAMSTLVSTILGLVIVIAILAWIVIRSQMRKVVTGSEGLINKQGIAKTALSPMGKVLIEGELWDAESSMGEISEGSTVIVESVDGFKLKVKKW